MEEEKKKDEGFVGFGDIVVKKPANKAPAHEFQDMALRIITELKIPNFKRGSVFKICKDNPKTLVMNAFNDTKELCDTGDQWKYFFKVIASLKNPQDREIPEYK